MLQVFLFAAWVNDMPVYLERFVIPILAAFVIAVIIMNPFKWDWIQRTTLFFGIGFIAFFFSYTDYKARQNAQTPPSVNTTNGPQSPIMPNNSGNATINGNDSKPEEPPPKDKPK